MMKWALHSLITFGLLSGLTTSVASGQGSEGALDGNVEAVAGLVDTAFQQLSIRKIDRAVTPAFAMIVGRASSGSRITVSVSPRGRKSAVQINSDGPYDQKLQKRVLSELRSLAP